MLKYIKPYRGYDALTIFFMVGEVLIDLYQPSMMEIIVNEGVLGLHHGGVPDLSLVMETGGMILNVIKLSPNRQISPLFIFGGGFFVVCMQRTFNEESKSHLGIAI